MTDVHSAHPLGVWEYDNVFHHANELPSAASDVDMQTPQQQQPLSGQAAPFQPKSKLVDAAWEHEPVVPHHAMLAEEEVCMEVPAIARGTSGLLFAGDYSSPHSRSSSPFSRHSATHSGVHSSLDSPLPTHAQQGHVWGGEEEESEGESASTSSGTAPAGSGVSTPFAQLHTAEQLSPSPPIPQQQHAQHPMLLLPTINEHLPRPQAVKSTVAVQQAHFDLKQEEEDDLPELHLGAPSIGAVGVTPGMDQPAGAVTSPTTERVCVRAKRRTRYTTAEAASLAARATVSASHAASHLLPHSMPRLSSHSSADSRNSQGDGSCPSGSASSLESQDDEEEEVYEEPAPKSSKRKRTASAKLASSGTTTHSGGGGSEYGGESSPPLKGLDKRERNKLSASQYRKRRKMYLDSLEGKVGELDQTIANQSETISKMSAENRSLKEQLNFLQKLVGHIQPTASSAAAAAGGEMKQASNNHTGARVGGNRGAAASFMFVVLCCILLLDPTAWFSGEESALGVATSAPMGRVGRKLLEAREEFAFGMPQAAELDSFAIVPTLRGFFGLTIDFDMQHELDLASAAEADVDNEVVQLFDDVEEVQIPSASAQIPSASPTKSLTLKQLQQSFSPYPSFPTASAAANWRCREQTQLWMDEMYQSELQRP